MLHLHRQVGIGTYPPMKMEQCSEMSAYKIQMPGNYPEESIQHSEHGESLKSRISNSLYTIIYDFCINGLKMTKLVETCHIKVYNIH